MNKFYLSIIAVALFTLNSIGSVTILYSNKDKKEHVLKVKIDGVYQEITFSANKTGKIKIKGKEVECLIVTSCGEVNIKDGDKFEILNGCIKR